MESLLDQLAPILSRFGPWLVFAIALLETSCFIGLLLPAEAVILMASFLAEDSYFSVESVFIAAAVGGFTGDQIGYLLGRYGGGYAAASSGRMGRIWRRHEVRAHAIFRKQPWLAISAARFISFVRTLTPWLAGMSGMRYRRFVIYDAIGVTAWAAASVALGYFAGQSWDAIAHMLGFASALILVIFLVVIYVLFGRKRRRAAAVAVGENADAAPYRVGLTGNIASGKSVVADAWRKLGAHIVDADELARDAVAPGSPGLAAVRARFGEGIITAEGELDRALLRTKVFGDDAARADLEAIVHPEVARLRTAAEADLVAHGATIVVHVIPLLFEVNLEDTFDEVAFVDAPAEVRLERLMTNRGLSEPEALAMIEAQMPAGDKVDRADHVLENTDTLAELESAAALVWRGITERACA